MVLPSGRAIWASGNYNLEEFINLQSPWSSGQSPGPFTNNQLIELVHIGCG
ncbi:hypothetical protein KBB96_15110 [Luteolibacter ambystomatis]|uniref:Uncharacterized protein n=1 Tax=Luteolibacter ambystomatis TaxID=2824561 RepID=A0A975IYG0_9BACT|nr:hypothetical protein [Luteolibacter ambystomatis]QUE50192.1 hypothetical protein KBB96_15110 [Luteolibacter ambystomatis]